MPLLSVIIPVYNAAAHLSKCLKSIIDQQFNDLEVLIVNDGSTDDSPQLIAGYAKQYPFIKLINQSNKGAAAARNQGIKNATGRYISFIDADDEIASGLYKKFAENIIGGDIDIFMFNGSFFRQGKTVIPFFSQNFFKPDVTENDTVTYKNINNFFYGNQSVCNKIYRTDFLRQNRFLMKEGSIFEDTLFNFTTLIKAEKIRFTYQSYYHYFNDTGDSVTHRIGKNALCLFDILEDMEKAAENIGQKDFFAYALFQLAYEKIIETLSLTQEDIRPKLFQRAKTFLTCQIKKLNPQIYQFLRNINFCFCLLHYTYEQFCDTLLLSRSDFKFSSKSFENPRFSLIVPMYNVERFIPLCLKSLINQSYENFEIICVDDGSPDHCKDLIKEYGKHDRRIKLIEQTNKGLGGARNTGVRAARGEYILFVDSDDWLSLNTLSAINDTIIKNPTDLGIISYNEFVDMTMQMIIPPTDKLFEKSDTETTEDRKRLLHFLPVAWTKYYKRTFFIDQNLFFTENVCFEDFYIHVKALICAQSIAFCPNALYYYRIRENSIMQSAYSEKKIDDLMTAFKDTLCWLKKTEFDETYRSTLAHIIAMLVNYHQQHAGERWADLFKNKISSTPELTELWQDKN